MHALVVMSGADWGCFQCGGNPVPHTTLQALQSHDAGIFCAASSPTKRRVAGYHWQQPTLAKRLETAVENVLLGKWRADFGFETIRVSGDPASP
ncbi:hypothetical protein [Pseudomonas sp. OTU5201]|uniref:hypothetical protein n=1 Tax=Pseudomonas sp. OTU5201 TaxID=3043850 RepID=UPI00313B9EFB